MVRYPVASLLQSPPLKIDIRIEMREIGPSSGAPKWAGEIVITLWEQEIEGRDRICSTRCGFQFSSYSRTSGSMTQEHEMSRPWSRVTRSLCSSTLIRLTMMISREPRCCFVISDYYVVYSSSRLKTLSYRNFYEDCTNNQVELVT
jgi:hypothetical protein